MLRFLKSPAAVTPLAQAVLPTPAAATRHSIADRNRRNDTAGALRRMRQTVEDNRLL